MIEQAIQYLVNELSQEANRDLAQALVNFDAEHRSLQFEFTWSEGAGLLPQDIIDAANEKAALDKAQTARWEAIIQRAPDYKAWSGAIYGGIVWETRKRLKAENRE